MVFVFCLLFKYKRLSENSTELTLRDEDPYFNS